MFVIEKQGKETDFNPEKKYASKEDAFKAIEEELKSYDGYDVTFEENYIEVTGSEFYQRYTIREDKALSYEETLALWIERTKIGIRQYAYELEDTETALHPLSQLEMVLFDNPIAKEFAERKKFSYTNAVEIINLFNALGEKKKTEWCPIYHTEFKSIEDYVKEWDDSWYRYYSWEALIKSEKEQGESGLTEEECKAQLGKSIFELSNGLYVQSVV